MHDPASPISHDGLDAQHSRAAAVLGEPVDLTAIDTTKPRPWTRGAHRILRPGVKAIWFSPRGEGKSLAALILAVQIIEAGGAVAYIDLENGSHRQAERLAAILADSDPDVSEAAAERLRYLPNARLTLPPPQGWGPIFAGTDLVVIDSTARALGHVGRDENSNADVARFMVEIVDPIAANGAAVLQLDNTGHDEHSRTRGGSAKLDLSELAYSVTAEPIGPKVHGTIRIQLARTRDGDEATTVTVGVGGGSYGRLQPPLHDGPDDKDAKLDRTLLAYIAEHPGESTESIARGVRKRPGSCRSRLEILKQVGTVVTRPSQTPDRHGRPRPYTGWHLALPSQNTTVPNSRTATDRQAPADHDRPTVPALIGRTGTVSGNGTPLTAKQNGAVR